MSESRAGVEDGSGALVTDAESARRAYRRLNDEVHKVIVGQDALVEQILLAVFCRGHALVVGVPGLAKTLLISTLAKSLSLGFSRVQFTPDLMPSDITGTEVIEEDKSRACVRSGLSRAPSSPT